MTALREVEELLTRLEAAESLYPSSQSMASHHPIYRCESFIGRVKAMCLWYNITKHQQLKLLMVGKLFKKYLPRFRLIRLTFCDFFSDTLSFFVLKITRQRLPVADIGADKSQ